MWKRVIIFCAKKQTHVFRILHIHIKVKKTCSFFYIKVETKMGERGGRRGVGGEGWGGEIEEEQPGTCRWPWQYHHLCLLPCLHVNKDEYVSLWLVKHQDVSEDSRAWVLFWNRVKWCSFSNTDIPQFAKIQRGFEFAYHQREGVLFFRKKKKKKRTKPLH